MSVRQISIGAGERRRPPIPGSPLVEVLLGARDGSPVGVVHVTVPPGGTMPEHDHGASDTLLIPVAGAARLIDVEDGERVVELAPGTLTTISVGARVRLENPGATEARLIVALTPPDFADHVRDWPAADD